MTLDCTCNRMKEAEEKAAKWDSIVRCRDCVHAKFDGGLRVCLLTGALAPLYGFCHRGDRREDA